MNVCVCVYVYVYVCAMQFQRKNTLKKEMLGIVYLNKIARERNVSNAIKNLGLYSTFHLFRVAFLLKTYEEESNLTIYRNRTWHMRPKPSNIVKAT